MHLSPTTHSAAINKLSSIAQVCQLRFEYCEESSLVSIVLGKHRFFSDSLTLAALAEILHEAISPNDAFDDVNTFLYFCFELAARAEEAPVGVAENGRGRYSRFIENRLAFFERETILLYTLEELRAIREIVPADHVWNINVLASPFYGRLTTVGDPLTDAGRAAVGKRDDAFQNKCYYLGADSLATYSTGSPFVECSESNLKTIFYFAWTWAKKARLIRNLGWCTASNRKGLGTPSAGETSAVSIVGYAIGCIIEPNEAAQVHFLSAVFDGRRVRFLK